MPRTLSTLALAASLCTTATVAHADTTDDEGPRSPAVAAGLSLTTTALAWGAVAWGVSTDHTGVSQAGLVGTLIAPSLGHVYAGDPLTIGLGLRAAGAIAVISGIGTAVAHCPVLADEPCESSDTALLLLTAGAIAYGTGTLMDVAGAGEAARAYNRRVRDLAITPTAQKDGAGLVVAGRF